MTTVAYITRDLAGTTQHGNFAEGTPARINAAPFKDVSLNLRAADVESYARNGGDLHITLANGQTLILENYFNSGTGGKNLFLSADNAMVEVVLEDKSGGMLFAEYEPLDLAGKWSSYDEMMFLDVDRIEPVVAPLAAPLFGGLGAAGAATGVAGAALIAGGGGDGGGGGGGGPAARPILPTVDDPGATYPVAGATTDPVVITGTGAPGSDVLVTLGDVTATGTVNEDGIWSVTFPADGMPADGSYDTEVQVTAPDGTEFDLDGPAVVIDTTPPEAVITSGAVSTGDMVNAEEQAGGTVITGTGEAGATVTLEIEGSSHSTTVADDGSWSLTFTPGEIPGGEYDTAISITTTDSFGNSATTADVLRVDTVAPPVARGTVEGDDVINAAEAADGVTLTGTSEPGASITVEFQGQTRILTASASGQWSATFAASEIAAGEYDAPVTVTATDAAGNSQTITDTLRVDTQLNAAYGASQAGGDNTVNAAEDAAGVTLTGTVDPGATVMVQLGGVSRAASVDAAGNWSATFADGDIPAGTYDASVVITATDAAGNVEQIIETLAVDTDVAPFTADPSQTADDVLNHAEHAAGLSLTGTVEAGSEVAVTINGITRSATVDSTGNWSAAFEAADLPEGSYSTSAIITATDAAGNTRTLSEAFSVDTDYETPSVDSVTFSGSDVRRIATEGITDSYTVTALETDGSTSSPAATVTTDPAFGTEFTFSAAIPDGTHLVVSSQDAAGNSSSALVVLNDNAGNAGTLDHAGLPQFNVDELNLDYASDVSLTLSEASIQALSGNDGTLTVHGGADDTLTVAGATAAGTRTEDGESFNVYTVGTDGTTLVVDEDINVVI